MRDSSHDNEHSAHVAGDERRRELLSALMDGETSEHELRQALRATEDDAALAATWRRWHLAQSALRGDRQTFSGVDLRSAIAARLDEPAAAGGVTLPAHAERNTPAWLKPLASVAVAASITVATVFAWQAFQPAPSALTGGQDVASAATASEPRVALGPMVMVREDGEELVMPVAAAASASSSSAFVSESPTAAQDRINAYMARHAQAAGAANARGLSPYARVVSLEGEQAP